MIDVRFKPAETADEIEQVHRLNHRIFAEEVGQHARTPDGRLIDKFHSRNRYFIATRGSELVGMVSAHDGPEFSIASRLKDVSCVEGAAGATGDQAAGDSAQVSQAVDFGGAVLAGAELRASASLQRSADFRHRGAAAHVREDGLQGDGPSRCQCGDAAFVPMRLSLDAASERFEKRERLYGARWRRGHATSLLPGPVAMSKGVVEAFHERSNLSSIAAIHRALRGDATAARRADGRIAARGAVRIGNTGERCCCRKSSVRIWRRRGVGDCQR